MAERACAAVNVDLVVVQIQIAHRGHGDDGERLVDLEQIHLGRGPAGLLEHFANRTDGRGGEPRGCLRMGGVSAYLGAHPQTAPLGLRAAHHHQRRGAVGDGAGVGRGDGAAFAEGGLEMRNLVEPGLARLLVDGDLAFACAAAHGDRDDLALEAAVFDGGLRAGERRDRECVLGLAGELVGLRAVLGEAAHETALVEGILETVDEHVIEHAAVTHAIAAAGLLEQIRRVAHALHAAGHHDLVAAGAQQIVGEHGRLHARPAHLVDGRAAGFLAEAGAEGGLPGGRLSLAGGQNAAHDDFLDVGVFDTRVADGAGDASRAELGGGHVVEVALEAAHRCTRCANDDDRVVVAHGFTPHPVSSKSSRPISMRRISEVPAPIS